MIPFGDEPSVRVVRDVGLSGSGSAASATAGTQSFTKGGGGHGAGLSGASAGAGSQTFSQGGVLGHGGFGAGMSGSQANAGTQSFGQQPFGFGGFSGANAGNK